MFTFLAQQLSRPGPHCPLRVERKHFERVVQYLTVPEENTLHDERQEAFQQLMLAGGLSHYQHDELLALARSAELLVTFFLNYNFYYSVLLVMCFNCN